MWSCQFPWAHWFERVPSARVIISKKFLWKNIQIKLDLIVIFFILSTLPITRIPMAENNKKHLYVKKDRNGWFYFWRPGVRVQLAGDQRLDWFWFKQAAVKAWLDANQFMADLTKILSVMEKDWNAIFSMYEPQKVK